MPIDRVGHGGLALAEAVRELYSHGQSDYSLEPIVLVNSDGSPIGRVQEGDTVIFCCRRGEREIQLTEAFVDPALDRFPRRDFRHLTFVTLTLYHEKFKDLPVAFAPTGIQDTLGEIVSRAGLRQMRLAESEKFAHVTFFFSGGISRLFSGEDRDCVPSPRGIPFEQVPELSLPVVTERILAAIDQQYDLIVANVANGDVIGHTHNRDAKLACARLVDARLGQIVQAALAAGYVTVLTADHGNLEEMSNADGTSNGSHTANPVPLLVIDAPARLPAASPAPQPPRVQASPTAGTCDPWECVPTPDGQCPRESGGLRAGGLSDVAPTVLQLMALAKPEAMTGQSVLEGWQDGRSARRVLLLILDGWGIGRSDTTNPIFQAETLVWDDLTRCYPCTQLQAAGQEVGLKAGKAGNSEAGHVNIGAGRVVLQDDVRLDLAMQDGSFYRNETLQNAIDQARRRQASLHLIGLLTEKSSHGSIDYPLALLRMARAGGLSRAYVHVIFDGRSTPPGSAPALLKKLESQVAEIGLGLIVSGVGRGLALDRDGNYEKTRRAYDALVFGTGRPCPAPWSVPRGS